MRRAIAVMALAGGFALLPGPAGAAILHATPEKGLRATLRAARAGDTVEMAPGVYRERNVRVPVDDLTIEGHDGAVVSGPGARSSYPGLVVAGRSGLVVRGLTVRRFGFGILLDDASGVLLAHLLVTRNDTGLRGTGGGLVPDAAVKDLTIRRSRFVSNRLLGFDCSPGPCNSLVIARSRFSGNGSGNNTAADGIGFEAGSAGILVRRSRASHNAGDGFDFKADDVTIDASRASGNTRNGIKLWQDAAITNSISDGNGLAGLVLNPGVAAPSASVSVINSTFARNGFGGHDFGEYAALDGGDLALTLRNDVFALNYSAFALGDGVALTEDHNLFHNPNRDYEIAYRGDYYSRADIRQGRWASATGQGGGDLTARPRFIAPGDGDYRLRAASPAVDAGSGSQAPDHDASGASRPQGSGYDMGAFER